MSKKKSQVAAQKKKLTHTKCGLIIMCFMFYVLYKRSRTVAITEELRHTHTHIHIHTHVMTFLCDAQGVKERRNTGKQDPWS